MADENFLKTATDENAADPILVLLRLTLDSETRLYFVNNDADITVSEIDPSTSQPITYLAFGFEFVEPAIGLSARRPAALRIDNLDAAITTAIRALTEKPRVRVQIVNASNPDVVQRSFPEFDLSNITWDRFSIEGQLTTPDDQDEPVCAHRYTPQNAPGLFIQ